MEQNEDLPQSTILHESLFTRIAAKSAEKIVSDFDKPISSRELKLLGLDRDRINEIRQEIDHRREAHSETIAALEADQLDALSYIPDDKVEIRTTATEKLYTRIQELNTHFLKEQLAHYATVDYSVSLALEAFYDTNTPLFARKALVRTLQFAMVNEQRKQLEDHTYAPLQWHFGIKDGMLFHAGNTIRSMSGFDRGLRNEALAQIAVSKVFSHEYCPYQPFSNEDQLQADPHLLQYVFNIPENKARFEELRALAAKEGNKYEEFRIRVNAGGGDEFLDVYGVSGPDSHRMVQLGRELKKGITNAQVLSPEYDVLSSMESRALTDSELARREWLQEKFPNSVNAFKVPGDSPEAKLLRNFWDKYRGYLMSRSNSKLTALFMDTRNDICFDMAEYENNFEEGTLPTIDDGIMLFIAGVDSKEKRLTNGEGEPLYGFYTPEGYPDEEKIELYAQTISERVRSQYRNLDISNSDEVIKIVSGLIQEDLLNGYVDYLNDQVNKVAKPRKKLQVLLNAYKYDPVGKDVFNVAATYATGRDVFVDLTADQKAILTVSVINEMERAIKNNPYDQSLQSLKREWDRQKGIFLEETRNKGLSYSDPRRVSFDTLPQSALDSVDFDDVLITYMTPEERRQQQR